MKGIGSAKKVAAGFDESKPVPIKYVSAIISNIVRHIVNRMLETDTFSDEFKVPRITPVYKGESKILLKNYRPIQVFRRF